MASSSDYFEKKREGFKIALKTKEQLDKDYYGTALFNERLLSKISVYWDPTKDDFLSNEDYKKTSMYHWYANSFFGNKLIISTLHKVFNRELTGNVFEENAQVHENSVWLYKGPQRGPLTKGRGIDWWMALMVPTALYSWNVVLLTLTLPYFWKFAHTYEYLNNYVLRIDLLPHTEQVVFLKAGFFGQLRRSYVDLKNLKRISPSQMKESWRIFQSVAIDKYQIWRDVESGENFVLDKYGIWSEEGINHPLIS